MNNIDRALKDLEVTDIYSVLLFAIFNLKRDPKYSTLCELCYVIDNNSFINMLQYFGGKTITIPTVKEFKDLVDSLCLYDLVNVDGIDYSRALKDLDISKDRMEEVSKIYQKICDILSKYNFKRD